MAIDSTENQSGEFINGEIFCIRVQYASNVPEIAAIWELEGKGEHQKITIIRAVIPSELWDYELTCLQALSLVS